MTSLTCKEKGCNEYCGGDMYCKKHSNPILHYLNSKDRIRCKYCNVILGLPGDSKRQKSCKYCYVNNLF